MSHGDALLGVGRGEGARGVVVGAAWRKTAGRADQTTSLTVMAFESAAVSAWWSCWSAVSGPSAAGPRAAVAIAVDGISPADTEEVGPGSAGFCIAGAIIVAAGGSEGGSTAAASCDERVVAVPSVATFATCPSTGVTGELVPPRPVEGIPPIADAASPTVPLEAVTVVEANCWTAGTTAPDVVVATFATCPSTGVTGELVPPRPVEGIPPIADAASPTVPLEAVTVVEANCWTAGMTVVDVVDPAAASCDSVAVTGLVRGVEEIPETADAASPTVPLEALTVVEVACRTGATRVSEVVVVAVTCETAAVTGLAASASGVVAFAGTVEADGEGGAALFAAEARPVAGLVGTTEVVGGATAMGVGFPVGTGVEGCAGAAAADVVVIVFVGDGVVGALVADDTALPTLAATPLMIPVPVDWLAFEVALMELPSAVGVAEAELERRSAIKNPSPHAKSAKTAQEITGCPLLPGASTAIANSTTRHPPRISLKLSVFLALARRWDPKTPARHAASGA
jgi:hypothetical protein